MPKEWLQFAPLIAIQLLFGTHAIASQAPKAEYTSDETPTIRVRIKKRSVATQIRGIDLSIRASKTTQKYRSFTSWMVSCFRKSADLLGKDGKKLKLPLPFVVESPAGFISVDGNSLRARVIVHGSKKGGCDIVNELSIERYLLSVVNSEFSSRWNKDAVAAQVIAARTYALYQKKEARRRKKVFDVEATIEDQLYRGPQTEDHLAAKVVRRTQGIVLAYNSKSNLYPIKAFYHSSCGGGTELPRNVWGKRYRGFKKVKCGFCKGAPSSQWNFRITPDALKRSIWMGVAKDGAPKGWPSYWRRVLRDGSIHSLVIKRKSQSGRIQMLQSVWKIRQGKRKLVARLDFKPAHLRKWIGNRKLKSTSFEIAEKGPGVSKHFEFDGKGFGHGVGLCQWGAKRMGEKGYKTAQILSHYYPGASIHKVW